MIKLAPLWPTRRPMMVSVASTTLDFPAERIVVGGDPPEVPRTTGRRQFSLSSMIWLLCAAGMATAIFRLIGDNPLELLGFELWIVYCWWCIAELRDEHPEYSEIDQTTLREEVRRWLNEHRLR